MSERKQPLRWRKQPNEQGLAGVCQSPRGAELRIGDRTLAHVYAYQPPEHRAVHTYTGWFWVAVSNTYGVPLKNTAQKPTKTIEGAKAAAKAYVLEHLKR